MPGERRLRLLFVCGGNTCRSAMAAALAKKVVGGAIEAESAGVDPGFSVTREAVCVMAHEFALDISNHEPRALDAVVPEHFDYIITLDPYVRKRFLEQFPSLSGKVMSWDVDDPFGQGMQKYSECAYSLSEKLQELGRELRAGREV